MNNEIEQLLLVGHDKGYTDGHSDGYGEGYTDGYSDGYGASCDFYSNLC